MRCSRSSTVEVCPVCPSHPLDGCTTVDYGAFGMTHDNRITFEGPAGPGALVQLDFAFSNIDDNAPDGSAGPTEVEVEIRLDP